MTHTIDQAKLKAGFPWTARQRRMQKSNRKTRKQTRNRTRNIG